MMLRAQGIELMLLALEAGYEIGHQRLRGARSARRRVSGRAWLLPIVMCRGWQRRGKGRRCDGEDVLLTVHRPLRLVAAIFLAPMLAAGPALGGAEALERTVEAVGVELSGGMLAAQTLQRVEEVVERCTALGDLLAR